MTQLFSPPAPAVLALDLDRLIVSRMLIQANSGGGKSRAIRWLLESTHGRVQHIVVDREGEFATLREKFPYLLVGSGGEIAADVRGAKLLARKLLELSLSAVLDLSDMGIDRQRDYLAEFVTGLCELPRELWKDCLIVIDEAHLFAPEKGKGDSVAREPIALLLSIGRKRGYCPVLATQRLAKLDKDAANECLNKMIGRTSDDDTKRAGEELGFKGADARELRSLEPGHFWAYGPAIGTSPELVRTGDVETHPPKRGAAREAPPPTPDAIAAVAEALRDLPQQEADEEKTIEGLRRRVADLTRQLEEGPATSGVEFDQRIAAERLDAAHQEWERHDRYRQVIQGQIECVLQSITGVVEEMNAGWIRSPRERAGAPKELLWDKLERVERDPTTNLAYRRGASDNGHGTPVPSPAPVAAAVRRSPVSPLTLEGYVPSETHQRILDSIAEYDAIGISAPRRSAVCAMAGISAASGPTGERIRELGRAGLIATEPGTLRLTEAGRVQANFPTKRKKLADLHASWLARVNDTEANLLRHLIEAYPEPVRRVELCAAVGISPASGPTGERIRRLTNLEVADIPQPGWLRASDHLFPKGVR